MPVVHSWSNPLRVILMIDFNNLLNIAFQQCVLLALPLTILAFCLFMVIRFIPSRLLQCLVPLVAGTLLSISYSSMNPANPGESSTILFLTGVLIHPLLVLPPIIFAQKYLQTLRTHYVVFGTIFLSCCLVITEGVMLGNVISAGGPAWQPVIAVFRDLFAASVVSVLVIGLDRLIMKGIQKKTDR